MAGRFGDRRRWSRGHGIPAFEPGFLFNLTENKNFIVDVYKRIDMYIQTCYYKIASRGKGVMKIWWVEENPVTYRKQQIRRQITRLLRERNRLIHEGGEEEKIKEIQAQIDELERQYKELQGRK